MEGGYPMKACGIFGCFLMAFCGLGSFMLVSNWLTAGAIIGCSMAAVSSTFASW